MSACVTWSGLVDRVDEGHELSRQEMSKRLFVGGLSWDTDDASFRRAFERFGEVDDAKVITDRETGRSRGFGFVTMVDDEAAENAIAEMDGAELDGRNVRVNEAQERAPRPRSFPGEGGGGGGGGDNRRRRSGGGSRRGNRRNRW